MVTTAGKLYEVVDDRKMQDLSGVTSRIKEDGRTAPKDDDGDERMRKCWGLLEETEIPFDILYFKDFAIQNVCLPNDLNEHSFLDVCQTRVERAGDKSRANTNYERFYEDGKKQKRPVWLLVLVHPDGTKEDAIPIIGWGRSEGHRKAQLELENGNPEGIEAKPNPAIVLTFKATSQLELKKIRTLIQDVSRRSNFETDDQTDSVSESSAVHQLSVAFKDEHGDWKDPNYSGPTVGSAEWKEWCEEWLQTDPAYEGQGSGKKSRRSRIMNEVFENGVSQTYPKILSEIESAWSAAWSNTLDFEKPGKVLKIELNDNPQQLLLKDAQYVQSYEKEHGHLPDERRTAHAIGYVGAASEAQATTSLDRVTKGIDSALALYARHNTCDASKATKTFFIRRIIFRKQLVDAGFGYRCFEWDDNTEKFQEVIVNQYNLGLLP